MKTEKIKPKRTKPLSKNAARSRVVITRWHVVKARIVAEVTDQVSRRGFAGSVSIQSGKLDFQHDGSSGFVSQADLERYAASMVEKGFASSASTDTSHVEIDITPRTAAILTGAKAARPTSVKIMTASAPFQVRHGGTSTLEIPSADKMMDACLKTIGVEAVQRTTVRAKVAVLLKFPANKTKLAVYEPGSSSRTSFSDVFGLVVAHLQKVGAVKAVGKKLVALPNVAKNSVPAFEPSKKAKARAAQPKTARMSGKMNVQRLVKSLPSRDPYSLLCMWKNAVRKSDDASQKHLHGDAAIMVSAISKEWDRRAKSLTDDFYFKWPTSEAPGGRRSGQYRDLRHEGMLKYLEYKVGKDGEHSSYRHALLTRIFENALPPVFDRLYMAEWGPNGSSIRLHKMAYCLASFAKNFKYQANDKYDEAIKHWEQDLAYLHDRYYVGRFGFGWPTTAV